MTVSSGFAELLADVLAPLGRVTVRRMFGGGGVMCDGVMFGLVSDDTLFLKADEASRKAFEDEGCGQFVYDGKGRPIALPYWRMPERLLDEPEEMVAWARTALGVALQRAAAKTAKKTSKSVKAAGKPKRAGPKPAKAKR